jgi:hypothetical protein
MLSFKRAVQNTARHSSWNVTGLIHVPDWVIAFPITGLKRRYVFQKTKKYDALPVELKLVTNDFKPKPLLMDSKKAAPHSVPFCSPMYDVRPNAMYKHQLTQNYENF